MISNCFNENGRLKSFTLLFGITMAILALSSLIVFSHIENVSAFDEDGHVEFIVSKMNESKTNNTMTNETIPIPDTAKDPSIPSKGYLVGN
jgi:hypothetical protein